jgi:hypothetical protein
MQLVKWAFVPNEKDSKHKGYIHPVFSLILSLGLPFLTSTYLDQLYDPPVEG